MKILIAFWNWLNNKKTYIGLALMLGTPMLFESISKPYAIWNHGVPVYFPQIEATIIWFGSFIGTVGAIHKMIKYKATTAENGN